MATPNNVSNMSPYVIQRQMHLVMQTIMFVLRLLKFSCIADYRDARMAGKETTVRRERLTVRGMHARHTAVVCVVAYPHFPRRWASSLPELPILVVSDRDLDVAHGVAHPPRVGDPHIVARVGEDVTCGERR